MKKTVFVAMLLLGGASHGEVITKHDRFRNTTTMTYAQPARSDIVEFHAFSVFDGESPASKRRNTIMLSSTSESWKYLRCRSVDFLIDGKLFSAPAPNHDGRAGRGYVLEFLSFSIPTEVIKKIGAAQLVEYRVCNDEYVLGVDDIKGLAELVKDAK